MHKRISELPCCSTPDTYDTSATTSGYASREVFPGCRRRNLVWSWIAKQLVATVPMLACQNGREIPASPMTQISFSYEILTFRRHAAETNCKPRALPFECCQVSACCDSS